jgi:heme-binding protein
MKKWIKRSLLILIAAIVVMQVVRPAKTNPASDPSRHIQAVLPVHAEIAATFARSCNDCHSNNTVWPWYSNVAPVSWLLASDVNEGRRELNFSTWGDYDPQKQRKLLGEICEQVKKGEMPEITYTFMHPKAQLNDADRNMICSWTAGLAPGTSAHGGEDD